MVKMCRLKGIWFMLLGWLMVSVSCQDSDLIPQNNETIGDGESELYTTIAFKPMMEGLKSRTHGEAIKSIHHLSILVYNENKELINCYDYTNTGTTEYDHYELDENVNRTDEDAENGATAESYTPQATLKMKLSYGRYYIYAVANMSDLKSTHAEAIKTVDGLKSIPLTWESQFVENDKATTNHQMFGHFTTETDKGSSDDAPILINARSVSLHAWIKRAASKVTLAYDGTDLYENIYIYIHSAQIKDIPAQCYLGKDNTPASAEDLLSNEQTEKIDYTNGVTGNTVGLTITKGNPKHGSDHSETANALYFFENMQGTTTADKGKYQDESGTGAVTHPNGSDPTDGDYKDGKPYGSYIEVKGYYINKTAANASQGPIVYRFMLGKDAIRDCNAERNYHYKLTLKFKNDANNPDWHIEYTPESPELSVPSPLYISYGYNEVLNIPVVVRGATVDASTTVTATIISNPWGYPEHPYYSTSNHNGPEDGFLSLENMDGTVSINSETRNGWNKEGSSFKYFTPTSVSNGVCLFTIPVYTRPLILDESLTGHNPYVSYERKATVQFQVKLGDDTYTQTTEVIQVKRLVNPTGVWRSDNNTSKFNVRLMELNNPDTDANGMVHEEFYAPLSDGPWKAHIEEGSDWVEIAPTDSENWGTSDVEGGTGTEIRFDYRPKGVNTTGNVRCGVIKVTYHNNTCVHYVFVSQGNGTVNLAGTNWLNRNILYQYKLVDNPLMEGSMFKFGNPWWAIKVENNHKDGYGFAQDCWGKSFDVYEGSADKQITFEGIGYNLATGFTNDRIVHSSATPSSYVQWKALEDLHRRYGVLYGDECNETKTTTTEAYSYYQVGQEYGMQGMFVWDESRDGNHIFFPIGSTGHGHRQVVDNDNRWTTESQTNIPYSVLKYAKRSIEMQTETASGLPMYYDLWLRKGAIYWYDQMNSAAINFDGDITDGYAHDINFHTMLLETYGSNAVEKTDKDGTESTDAAFIRCVEN